MTWVKYSKEEVFQLLNLGIYTLSIANSLVECELFSLLTSVVMREKDIIESYRGNIEGNKLYRYVTSHLP